MKIFNKPAFTYGFIFCLIFQLLGGCGFMRNTAGKQTGILPDHVVANQLPVFTKDTPQVKPTPTGLKLLSQSQELLKGQQEIKSVSSMVADQSRQTLFMLSKQDSLMHTITSLTGLVNGLNDQLLVQNDLGIKKNKMIDSLNAKNTELQYQNSSKSIVDSTNNQVLNIWYPLISIALIIFGFKGGYRQKEAEIKAAAKTAI